MVFILKWRRREEKGGKRVLVKKGSAAEIREVGFGCWTVWGGTEFAVSCHVSREELAEDYALGGT